MPENGGQADGLSESQVTSRSTNVSDDKLTEVSKLDFNIFYQTSKIKELPIICVSVYKY